MHRRRTEPRHLENAWSGFPDPSDPSEAAKQSVSTIMHAEPETRANMHTRISRILRNIVRDDPPAPQPRRTDVYIGHGGYALLFLQAYRASRVRRPAASSRCES